MGVPVRTATGTMGVDNLSEKAAKMRESLKQSQTITENMVYILGSFDHRLSALETVMRPTQVSDLFFNLG
ncbi:putative exocyst complex component Exo70 [Helianthus annuus]|nr:putative exocyst complex component Exo70 [Helianthus annuus]